MSKLGDLVSAVGGRLTLATGVPVTMTDQTAKTTLYYTPYIHNKIALYDGSNWKFDIFPELSITLAALTAGTPYDVFCYDNAGTPTLELLVWTNTTTRATALVYQDGVLVKSGATTRRYLGTICITVTTGQCEDSLLHRYVWNYYNRRLRKLYVTETTAHNYTTAAWQKWNNGDAAKWYFVIGVAEDALHVDVVADIGSAAGGTGCYVGADMDTTNDTTPLASSQIHIPGTVTSFQAGYGGAYLPAAGYHFVSGIEYGAANTSQNAVSITGILPA